MFKKYLILTLFVFVFITNSNGQDSTRVVVKSEVKTTEKVKASYGGKGFQFDYGENNRMQLELRIQSRYLHQSIEPKFGSSSEDTNDKSFNLQRVRLKIGGYGFKPYIKYYLEYDFPSNNLLNTVVTISKYKALQLKLGQWKIKYNTERYISSGKQELVDRSISNRYFTLDRQIGVMLLGDIFDGTLVNSSYNIGLFNGNGINTQNDDGNFLFFARYQLNLWNRKIKMSFSDLDITKKPEGFIALAYTNNESRFTSFSSSGGGQLPGYNDGNDQNYKINQYNFEVMFKYNGFTITSENHIKDIKDMNDIKLDNSSQLIGGYVMAGYFLNQIASFVPEPLEIIARYAHVNNKTLYSNNINEYIVGANWFFSGHKNKLTFDLSYVENQDFIGSNNNVRFRLQWDVSF